jgi:hypothetical protein
MPVSCECCVLSVRTHSSRGILPSVVCLNECDFETSSIRRLGTVEAVQAQRRNTLSQSSWHYPGMILLIRFI